LGYSQLAAVLLWDYRAHYSLATRFLQAARDLGALRFLPWALEQFALVHVWGGALATAASLIAEEHSVLEATGSSVGLWPVGQVVAWRGREAEANPAIAAGVEQARAQGQGAQIKALWWAKATLDNGLGHYTDAMIAAERATSPPVLSLPNLALSELVEAAVTSGRPTVATNALERLSESTMNRPGIGDCSDL
jgi:hypothetical protein